MCVCVRAENRVTLTTTTLSIGIIAVVEIDEQIRGYEGSDWQ